MVCYVSLQYTDRNVKTLQDVNQVMQITTEIILLSSETIFSIAVLLSCGLLFNLKLYCTWQVMNLCSQNV